MKKYRAKIGDTFEVALEGEKKGYVQYIGNDMTQLNTDVVRVFKNRYPTSEAQKLLDVINDEVEFYAHCVGVEFGVEDGSWKYVGNLPNIGDLKIPLFKDYLDVLTPVKVAHFWRVWRINEEMINVGELRGENTQAEPGEGFWPKHIVTRMNTGKYPGHYPDYK